MGEWRQTAFSSLMERGVLQIGDGYRAKLSELGGNGPVFLRAAHMKDDGFVWTGADRFYEQRLDRVRTKYGQVGDTVITTKGNSVGRTGYVPRDAPEFIYSPHLSYWRSLDQAQLDSRFIRYWSRSDEFYRQLKSMAYGTDMAPYFSLADQRRLRISLPSVAIQGAIGSTLEALDDKIAVNERIADAARRLGEAKFCAAAGPSAVDHDLSSISTVLTRGVAPRYSEDADALLVLNQRCIRGGRVSLKPAKHTAPERVPEHKLLRYGDILVNSTGVGTLGRVARWSGNMRCTVDSHVTIVRFDEGCVDSACATFAMLAGQSEIERLGEGSTGQTELSRAKLGAFRIRLPKQQACAALRPALEALESRSGAALAENQTLAALRDTLLPKLMSGELRVRDAERVVEDAT